MNKHYKNIALITVVVILLDQLSKFLILRHLDEPLSIISDFFQFQYSENFGIAFGINVPFGILIVANLFLLAVIAIFASQELNLNKKLSRYSIAFIIGGGIANLIDRLTQGFVVDFISIGSWPIFNIADIFITLGALQLIVFYAIIKGSHRTQKANNGRKRH